MIKTAIIIERADISLGGAERSVTELAQALSAAGVQAKILAATGQSESPNVEILCQNVPGKRITFADFQKAIHKHLQDNIWNVRVDPGQIEQVLINLYLNAWHAMPQGGDLSIQTENVYLSDHYCKPFEVTGGNYVKISVTDTGIV